MSDLSPRDLIELKKLYAQYGQLLSRLFDKTLREADSAVRVHDDAFMTAVQVAKREGAREALARIMKTLTSV